jgi:hypothetical protein
VRGYEHEHVDQAARALLAGVTGQTVVRRLEGIGHAGVMDRARFGMKTGCSWVPARVERGLCLLVSDGVKRCVPAGQSGARRPG